MIGNSAQYRKQSEKWNIYEEITSDGKDFTSVTQCTQEICKSLFSDLVERNSSNPFFPIAARDLLASIIVALVREGVVPDNCDIKNYIDATPVEELRVLLGRHKELASVASYIGGKAGSQAQGVLSEMYSVVRDIFTGNSSDRRAVELHLLSMIWRLEMSFPLFIPCCSISHSKRHWGGQQHREMFI